MAKTEAHGARLIKNSVYTLISSIITVVFTMVTSVIVARILKPSNYGIYNLILWFTGIFTWGIGMGLTHAITKYVSEYQGRRQPENISSIIVFVLRIELIVSAITTVILIFFKTEISDFFFSPNESFFFLLAFIGLMPGIVTAIFSSAIEGIQKFEYFTYFQLIITPFAFVTKMVVLYLGFQINGLLMVSLVFSAINVLFFYIVLKKEKISLNVFANPLKPDIREKIRKYNFSVGAILVADKVVWDKSENFFLGRYCTSVQIGFYNLAFNVVQRIMGILPTTFWRVLFPAMSSYFGSGDNEKIKRLFYLSSRYLAFFAFPLGAAGIILAYPILHFLYGHDFVGAKFPMQVIFFSSIFGCLSKPGSAILFGTEKQAFILKYGMFLAVVNIILDLFLIARFGALGAAFCYSLTTIAGSVGGLIYTCKKMKLDYPFRSIFKIIFSTIIMSIVMQLILKEEPEIWAFLLSILAGGVVYFVTSVVLGSFEEEDFTLMNSVKSGVPRGLRPAVDFIILTLIKMHGAKEINKEISGDEEGEG